MHGGLDLHGAQIRQGDDFLPLADRGTFGDSRTTAAAVAAAGDRVGRHAVVRRIDLALVELFAVLLQHLCFFLQGAVCRVLSGLGLCHLRLAVIFDLLQTLNGCVQSSVQLQFDFLLGILGQLPPGSQRLGKRAAGGQRIQPSLFQIAFTAVTKLLKDLDAVQIGCLNQLLRPGLLDREVHVLKVDLKCPALLVSVLLDGKLGQLDIQLGLGQSRLVLYLLVFVPGFGLNLF